MGLLESMAWGDMDDTGMWLWAGILAIVGLAASFAIAVWWQRRKDRSAREG